APRRMGETEEETFTRGTGRSPACAAPQTKPCLALAVCFAPPPWVSSRGAGARVCAGQRTQRDGDLLCPLRHGDRCPAPGLPRLAGDISDRRGRRAGPL